MPPPSPLKQDPAGHPVHDREESERAPGRQVGALLRTEPGEQGIFAFSRIGHGAGGYGAQHQAVRWRSSVGAPIDHSDIAPGARRAFDGVEPQAVDNLQFIERVGKRVRALAFEYTPVDPDAQRLRIRRADALRQDDTAHCAPLHL